MKKASIILSVVSMMATSCGLEQIVLYKQEYYQVEKIEKYMATCSNGEKTVVLRHLGLLSIGDTLVNLKPFSSFVIKRNIKKN